MFKHGKELFFTRASATDAKEDAHRFAVFPTGDARSAVRFDIFHQFMVDIVANELKVILAHTFQGFLVETIENLITEIGTRSLNDVDGAFGKVKGHRPVVGNGVNNMG